MVSVGYSPPHPNKKVSPTLAKAIPAQPSFLLGEVDRFVMKSRASKPKDRRQDVIHPSETTSHWCPRKTYDRILSCREHDDCYLDPHYSAPDRQRGDVFEVGHYTHEKWQRRFGDMGLLWGEWICETCSGAWFGFKSDNTQECVCFNANHPQVSKPFYNEFHLSSFSHMLFGSTDGIIPSKKAILEIKTIGSGSMRWYGDRKWASMEDNWKLLNAPYVPHILQASLYAYLLNLHDDYTRIYGEIETLYFLYELKDSCEVKEFAIPYDPELPSLKKILDLCLEVCLCLDDEGRLPDCLCGKCPENRAN